MYELYDGCTRNQGLLEGVNCLSHRSFFAAMRGRVPSQAPGEGRPLARGGGRFPLLGAGRGRPKGTLQALYAWHNIHSCSRLPGGWRTACVFVQRAATGRRCFHRLRCRRVGRHQISGQPGLRLDSRLCEARTPNTTRLRRRCFVVDTVVL